ncbi:MAG: DUF3261 domain-containing protein [Treponema sp.]|nr:DUF3261 domain-containing protein [Treponema sp.]
MRDMKLLFFSSVCIIFILSCTSIAKKDILYINLTDNSKFVLLPPEGIEQTMDMLLFLSAEFMGQNYFLNSWVKADEDAIEMIFFNEMGASIGELSYKNGAVNFSSAVIPRSITRSFKPEYIIADFQFCFYDPFLLDKSLKDSGFILEINDGIRRILSGNNVIIEIEKKENTVKLVNHLRRYTYTLEGEFHE